MICLDTDVIIDFLKNKKETVKKIQEIREGNIEIATTAINTFEMIKGVLHSNNENTRGLTKEFLSNLKILEFNFQASEKAAEIFENLKVKGQAIDPLDLMIASIALVNKTTLFTNNIKHFERIPDLVILKT